jgi:hypothetical protein
VRKVVSLAFEKNLMRANAIDFKKCSIGVVDFVEPELVPVLMVMHDAEVCNFFSWAERVGRSITESLISQT